MPEKHGRVRSVRGVLLFFVVFVIVAITRAPFYSMTLAGEEGEFGRSVVMIDEGRLPRGIIARTPHGAEFAIPAGHNLGGYLLPAALLLPAVRITGFTSLEQRRHLAVALRACITLLYGAALLLALVLLEEAARLRGAALLVAFSLPVLPLLGSVQVNYDGAISTLLVVAGLCLSRLGLRSGRLGWHIAAGVVLSFGKVEFAIATLTALTIGDAVARRWRTALACLVGFCAGELCWRALDPTNFQYGITLITRYWQMQGGTDSPIAPRAWLYAREHFSLLWPVYAALSLSVGYLAVRRRELRATLPVLLTLVFILGAYHAIAWRGDGFPRYFGPCFPLAAILLAELELPSVFGFTLAASLCLAAVPSYARTMQDRQHALAHLIHSTRDDLELARELEQDPRGCIVDTDMDSGLGFYSRTASFACCGAQWDGWVGEHNGMLCRRAR